MNAPAKSSAVIVGCLSLFLNSPSVCAAVTNWDHQPGSGGFPAIRAGDNIWIDTTVTKSRSYNGALAEIGPGLQFAGWRVASAAELSGLLGAAGLVGGQTVRNREPAMELMAIWGGPYYDLGGRRGVQLIVADKAGGLPNRQTGEFSYDSTFGWSSCCGGNGSPDDQSFSDHAVVLVRQIPEPPGARLALMAGLLAVCGICGRLMARRRKTVSYAAG